MGSDIPFAVKNRPFNRNQVIWAQNILGLNAVIGTEKFKPALSIISEGFREG